MRNWRPPPALALVAASCANMRLEPSGFLPDFERLQPAPELQVAFIPDEVRWWQEDSLDWSQYSEVVVEPVEWRPGTRRARRVSDKAAHELCAHFREVLSGRLSRSAAENAPGARSVTVRAAITDVASSNVPVNVVALIVLFPIDMGGIRAEVELRDTATGEPLAAMCAYREGTPLLLIECFFRYGHARHGMYKWSKLLSEKMSSARASP